MRDIFAMQRDHYEGTEFDLTKGLAGNAFRVSVSSVSRRHLHSGARLD